MQKIESIYVFVFKECSVDFCGKRYTKVQRDMVAKLVSDQIYPNIFQIIWYELINSTEV